MSPPSRNGGTVERGQATPEMPSGRALRDSEQVCSLSGLFVNTDLLGFCEAQFSSADNLQNDHGFNIMDRMKLQTRFRG